MCLLDLVDWRNRDPLLWIAMEETTRDVGVAWWLGRRT